MGFKLLFIEKKNLCDLCFFFLEVQLGVTKVLEGNKQLRQISEELPEYLKNQGKY